MLCSSAVTDFDAMTARGAADNFPRSTTPGLESETVLAVSLRTSGPAEPSAGPTAAGSTSASSRPRRYAAPVDPPVPVLAPIIRSTITTCRARQAAASSSCRISASAIAQRSPYDARSCATVRSDAVTPRRWRCRAPRSPQHVQERVPQRRLVQPPAQALLSCVGEAPEAVDVRRGPWPRRGTPARGTAPTGTRSRARAAAGTPGSPAGSSSPARRSAGRARRSITCTRLSRWRAHHSRSRPPLGGPGCREQRVADRLDLVQQLLEPQLVDLVDRDEQQLVVRRRVGLEVLGVEQLRAAGGSCRRSAATLLRALLAERARSSRLPWGQPMRPGARGLRHAA